jgi:sulfur carrier protein
VWGGKDEFWGDLFYLGAGTADWAWSAEGVGWANHRGWDVLTVSQNEARNEVVVNQRARLPWHEGMTVRDVLTQMKYTFPHVVVIIDGVVVRHDAYETTTIPAGADVRVVHLIAGG